MVSSRRKVALTINVTWSCVGDRHTTTSDATAPSDRIDGGPDISPRIRGRRYQIDRANGPGKGPVKQNDFAAGFEGYTRAPS